MIRNEDGIGTLGMLLVDITLWINPFSWLFCFPCIEFLGAAFLSIVEVPLAPLEVCLCILFCIPITLNILGFYLVLSPELDKLFKVL